eukprot:GILK01002409.1.p2 GENE.GILK01002409.1~~GILK01002409.1.p2  ORF type:complete len:187 (-),score=39.14 GILK01002409.1:807-1367(-)
MQTNTQRDSARRGMNLSSRSHSANGVSESGGTSSPLPASRSLQSLRITPSPTQLSSFNDKMERTFNTAMSPNGAANLKARLSSLEEIVNMQNEELSEQRNLIERLSGEKKDDGEAFERQFAAFREQFAEELHKMDEELKRHISHQKIENSRLQQQVTQLKGEKTAMQSQMGIMQRRIDELESAVGQ